MSSTQSKLIHPANMMVLKSCLLFSLVVAFVNASPAPKEGFWKGTPFDESIEEMRSMCAEDDPIACLKFKAISFLDSLLKKDYFQVSDDVEVSRNNYSPSEITGRSDQSLENRIEDYVKTHDVTMKVFDSKVTLGARNIDSDELDVKVQFAPEDQARKSKLKKIVTPILVFVLLKAMTLVPLAIGILALKAWNALQLSFFSFIIAVGLAIFQLCKKIASEHAPPQIASHAPWEAPAALNHFAAARSYQPQETAQELAYKAHTQ